MLIVNVCIEEILCFSFIEHIENSGTRVAADTSHWWLKPIRLFLLYFAAEFLLVVFTTRRTQFTHKNDVCSIGAIWVLYLHYDYTVLHTLLIYFTSYLAWFKTTRSESVEPCSFRGIRVAMYLKKNYQYKINKINILYLFPCIEIESECLKLSCGQKNQPQSSIIILNSNRVSRSYTCQSLQDSGPVGSIRSWWKLIWRKSSSASPPIIFVPRHIGTREEINLFWTLSDCSEILHESFFCNIH